MKYARGLLLALLVLVCGGALQAQAPYGETLYEFTAPISGPTGDLLRAGDGNLYGLSADTAYKVTPAGVFSVVARFGGEHGTMPVGGLTLGGDGNFYGVTREGGNVFTVVVDGGVNPNDGSEIYYYYYYDCGTAFRITPAGVFSTIYKFPTPDAANGNVGQNPRSKLFAGADGALYGTTDGESGVGSPSIYRFTLHAQVTSVFSGPVFSNGVLAQRGTGNFYGAATSASGTNQGAIVRTQPTGGLVTVHPFVTYPNADFHADGGSPFGGLLYGPDDKFYGTEAGSTGGFTTPGETFGCVFSQSPDGSYARLHKFDGTDGATPLGTLALGPDGDYCGTTSLGGPAQGGTVFKVSPQGNFESLAAFTRGYPNGGGVFDEAGNFFVATTQGGSILNDGAVYKITPQGKQSQLTNFLAPVGINPAGRLLQASNHVFYGVTSAGAVNNWGAIFKLTPAGDVTPLTPLTDDGPAGPGSKGILSLLQATDGHVYGLSKETIRSDYEGGGTIFQLHGTGTPTVLASLPAGTQVPPDAVMIEGEDGSLYCTGYGPAVLPTAQGPAHPTTVFRVSLQGEVSTYFFTPADGYAFDIANLVKGRNGHFYTYGNIPKVGYGLVEIGPAGLVPVGNSHIGDANTAGVDLIEGSDGFFYGATSGVIDAKPRTILFRESPSGDYQELGRYAVLIGKDLVRDNATGAIYGLGYNAVYQLGTGGYTTLYQVLYAVTSADDHAHLTGLTRGMDGNLYTALTEGNFQGGGEIIKVVLPGPPTVTTTAASAVASQSATLTAYVNAHTYAAAPVFRYGTSPNALTQTAAGTPASVTGDQPEPVSALLTGLFPGTTYYYQAAATNSAGTNAGSVLAFTTVP